MIEIEILPTAETIIPCATNEIITISPIPEPLERQSKPRKRKNLETGKFQIKIRFSSSLTTFVPPTDDYDMQYLEIAKQQLKTANDRLLEHQRTNSLLQELINVIKNN